LLAFLNSATDMAERPHFLAGRADNLLLDGGRNLWPLPKLTAINLHSEAQDIWRKVEEAAS
jgi:hypothetical protein